MNLQEAARSYAARGWPVMPCHSMIDGKCSCGKTCDSPGKHPRTLHGLKDATTDREQIEKWWIKWPTANIAIVPADGLAIIDIDPRNGGDESLEELKTEYFAFPATIEVATGGGGTHFYFAARGVRSRKGWLPGIDVKAVGGYVIAPPSNHVAGVYSWRRSPEDTAIAKMPGWLLTLLALAPKNEAPHNQTESSLLLQRAQQYVAAVAGANEGKRNDSAFSIAGHVAAFVDENGGRLNEHQIVSVLAGWNIRNNPPLCDDELRIVVASAMANGTARPAKIVERGVTLDDVYDDMSGDVNDYAEDERDSQTIRLKALKADPATIANEIIEANKTDGLPRIRFWNEEFWHWADGRYVERSISEVRAGIVTHFVRDWTHVKGEHVSNVTEHLRARTILPSSVTVPTWLRNQPNGFDPHECLATTNQIVHLPSLIEKRELFSIPATPAFFNNNACDFELNLDAPRPEAWHSFLETLWGDDQQSIDTLQEMFGYLLTADTRQQKIFLLIGPARSGKGTIGRILRKLVGDRNVAGPTLTGLAGQFGLSQLVGKSLAIVADARLSKKADPAVAVERLLAISGEDKLTIDRKHITCAIHCQLPTRILILSNELPRLSDASGTIVSRFILLQTSKSFLGSEDHDLEEKLTAELPGILLWAIDGWRRLQERGRFQQPGNATESIDRLTDLASPITAFVRECCRLDPVANVTVSDLFDRWQKWCTDQGRDHTENVQTFGRDLHAAYPAVRTCQRRLNGVPTRVFDGLCLAA